MRPTDLGGQRPTGPRLPAEIAAATQWRDVHRDVSDRTSATQLGVAQLAVNQIRTTWSRGNIYYQASIVEARNREKSGGA
jgi:hypothetical protein